MKANIVIDLAWGDCGKGITTARLCQQEIQLKGKPLVVRSGAGPNCGHTVMYNGKKHVFSTYGSGTLQGVPTYYTEDAVIYPAAMMVEFQKLAPLITHTPVIMAHSHTSLMVPEDILVNAVRKQANPELSTTGTGMFPLFDRERKGFKIYAHDLLQPKILAAKRIALFEQVVEKWVNQLEHLQALKRYDEECAKFDKAIEMAMFPLIVSGSKELFQDYTRVVFEGNQGILLDYEHGIYPDMTPSSCTSRNALRQIDKMWFTEITKEYVTRSYGTRHGAGYFPSEFSKKAQFENPDEINEDNPFQGEFRQRYLTKDLLRYAHMIDAGYQPRSAPLNAQNLHVTCCDIHEPKSTMFEDMGFKNVHFYYGPAVEDIFMSSESLF